MDDTFNSDSIGLIVTLFFMLFFVLGIVHIFTATTTDYNPGVNPKKYKLRMKSKNYTRCYVEYTINGWRWKKIPLSVSVGSYLPRINYYELLSKNDNCEYVFAKYKEDYYSLLSHIEDIKVTYRLKVEEHNARIFYSYIPKNSSVNNKTN